MVYSHSEILYENIPDAVRSSLDLSKPKSGPHVDGIVGSIQNLVVEQFSNQMKSLSRQHSVVGEATAAPSPSSQTIGGMICLPFGAFGVV